MALMIKSLCGFLLILITGLAFLDPTSVAVAQSVNTCQDTICASNTLQAGFAKMDISPQVGVDLIPTLDGAPQLVKKVHDPLYAKALVVADERTSIAFVALDLCFLEPEAFGRVREFLQDNSDHDHIVLAVTHTHSGLLDHLKLDFVQTQGLAALNAANDSLQPVSIGAASIEVDEAYNRRILQKSSVEMLWQNPQQHTNRAVDTHLGVIHFKDRLGEPVVSIVNYSAHPTITMDLHNVVVSADYPGALAAEFKSIVGGEVLFVLGAAGDVNPYHSGTQPLALALEKSAALGTRLAYAGARALQSINDYTDQSQLGFSKQLFSEPATEVSAIRFTQNIALATFPGEYFNNFGEQLKARSPIKHTFFIGYSNGSLGYVPTAADLALGGYGAEPDSIHPQTTSTTGQAHVDSALQQIMSLAK